MESQKIDALRFLGNPQQCVLPLYQRPYSWEKNVECKVLFENLYYIGNAEDRANWYLGAIVCQDTGGNLANPVFVLIDGQQRITTLTILICAMTEYLRKHPKTKLDEVKNWDSMLKTYVVNSEAEGEKWYRLLLNNEDKKDLQELIFKVSKGEDIPKYRGKSNIFDNFHWFKRKLNKNNIKTIYEGLKKLELILISLDEHDVAQNIFETLNSTGRGLTNIDKIRNYLLMGVLSEKEAEELYNYYWRPMELSFENNHIHGNNHVDYFVRYYLMMKLKKPITKERVYDDFRMVSDNFENATFCIKELNEFSKYYLNLFGNLNKCPEFKKEFKDFYTLRMRVFAPFLMKLLQQYKNGQFTKQECSNIFKLCIGYYLRKSLCGWTGNSAKDLSLKLLKVIENGGNYSDILEFMLSLKSNDRMVSDSMLKEFFIIDFKTYSKNHFVFSNLINFHKIASIDTSDLKVVRLFDDVDVEYSNQIGNLTLEGIDLCMDIEADSDEEFIDKRTEALIDLILKVWEYPSL